MTEKRCIANQIEAEEIFGDKASECNSCPCETGLANRAGNNNVGRASRLSTADIIPVPLSVIPAEAGIQTTKTIKEEPMATRPRGTCSNCKRIDMAIAKASGAVLCGSCLAAIAGSPPGSPERAEKLKKAAEKFAGKPKMSPGRQIVKVEAKPKECRAGVPPVFAEQPGSAPPAPPQVREINIYGNVVDQESFAQSITKKRTLKSILDEAGIPPYSSIITLCFVTPADHKLLDAIEALARQYRRTPDQQILWMVQNEKQLHEELLKEAGNAL